MKDWIALILLFIGSVVYTGIVVAEQVDAHGWARVIPFAERR